MNQQNQTECGCERSACGCGKAVVTPCKCGQACACKETCRCSGGCACTPRK